MSVGRLIPWKEWGPLYMRKLGYPESEIIKTFPHLATVSGLTRIGMDTVKHGISRYLEPDCEILTKGGKICTDKNIFKSRGETKSCAKYCIEHCDQWFLGLIYNMPLLQYFNPETKEWEGPYKDLEIHIRNSFREILSYKKRDWYEMKVQERDEVTGFRPEGLIIEHLTPEQAVISICSYIKSSGKIDIIIKFNGKSFTIVSEALSIISIPKDYKADNLEQVRWPKLDGTGYNVHYVFKG